MVADRAGESRDRGGADTGEARVGGGWEWASVLHCGADFDAGGKLIKKQATGFFFQNGDEVGRRGEVFRSREKRGGELAFEAARGGFEFRPGARRDKQRVGAEDFVVQLAVLEKIVCVGGEDDGLAVGFRRDGFGVRHGERDDARDFFHAIQPVMIRGGDARVQHGAGRGAANSLAELLREILKILAAESEDEPRFCAELADAHRDRSF